jgi:hypothetical protein
MCEMSGVSRAHPLAWRRAPARTEVIMAIVRHRHSLFWRAGQHQTGNSYLIVLLHLIQREVCGYGLREQQNQTISCEDILQQSASLLGCKLSSSAAMFFSHRGMTSTMAADPGAAGAFQY